MTTRDLAGQCPTCEKLFDAATGIVEDVAPAKDDVSICFGCGELLVFTNDTGAVRAMTPDEFLEIPDEPRQMLAKARRLILELDLPF